MPTTSNPSSALSVRQLVPGSGFTLAAPPSARKRHTPRRPVAVAQTSGQQPCKPVSPPCSPRSSSNRRRPSIVSRSPTVSAFLSFVQPHRNTTSTRRGSVASVSLGISGARLPPAALNTIVAFASGKTHRRSLSGPPDTACSFETHFNPSPPTHTLSERTTSTSNTKQHSSLFTKPNPFRTDMTSKDNHINVLLLPKRRDKESAPSLKSNASGSTTTSKSKSRKDAQSAQASSSSTKTPRTSNPALRAQRSLTPAREVFRPLPYATHAALDEFFGDPRKMNALHAHQSSSNQLGARSDEIGYGNSIGHKGADGWIWFDAVEEQEYAWLMGEAGSPVSPEAQPKEKKKPKRKGLLGRRGSAASEFEGARVDWESFDALRRGSESGTSETGIVDPMTYDLDPTRPPRYRVAAGESARYKVDATAWDAAVHARSRQNVGGTSAPKSRRGRSRRGSVSQGDPAERRRPPPLNLAAVSSTLATLGPQGASTARPRPDLTARRPSLPAHTARLPPSLADTARADFVSSSFQPNPSKRNLDLGDLGTPWSANLPKETIYRTIGPAIAASSAAPNSPFKAMFARRASLTPLPLRHSQLPLPRTNSNSTYEFKETGDGILPKLPPMPMENGAPAPGEGRRKTSLADIIRRGFSARGARKH